MTRAAPTFTPGPEPDGTYKARVKYGLISAVIHEVGHNYFPVVVNAPTSGSGLHSP